MGRLGRARNVAISITAVALAIALWALMARRYDDPVLLPSPGDIVSATRELIDNGRLKDAVWVSLRRVYSGWVMGSVIAIPIGLLAGTSRLVRAAVDPFIHFFRFVPALALTSLFIVWFGIGEPSKVNLIAYAVAFTVLVATASGASSINPDKLLGAQTLGAGKMTLFFRVILPGTFGAIYNGMRLALANAFLVLVAAEAIAAQEGIGFMIWNSRLSFRTDFVFVGILSFGVLGFISDRIWRFLGSTLLKRYLSDTGDY